MPYTAAVDFTAAKTYTIEYRATDNKDNVSAVKTATFKVLEIHDDDRPDGHRGHRGQPGPAQLLHRLRHAHADGHR